MYALYAHGQIIYVVHVFVVIEPENYRVAGTSVVNIEILNFLIGERHHH